MHTIANLLQQDLHIHTTWSTGDSAVAMEQTVSFVAELHHAQVRGISDHFDYLTGNVFEAYRRELRSFGFLVGTEVNGYEWTREALAYPFDYYIYHCRDEQKDYKGADHLLTSGKPVIIAHPFTMNTDIHRVAPECYIEINNRYIWRHDWMSLLRPHVKERRFILSSDAHQPNWLSQNVAFYVAKTMHIEEEILFTATVS